MSLASRVTAGETKAPRSRASDLPRALGVAGRKTPGAEQSTS